MSAPSPELAQMLTRWDVCEKVATFPSHESCLTMLFHFLLTSSKTSYRRSISWMAWLGSVCRATKINFLIAVRQKDERKGGKNKSRRERNSYVWRSWRTRRLCHCYSCTQVLLVSVSSWVFCVHWPVFLLSNWTANGSLTKDCFFWYWCWATTFTICFLFGEEVINRRQRKENAG